MHAGDVPFFKEPLCSAVACRGADIYCLCDICIGEPSVILKLA